jgi:hypothetical protein
MRLDSVLETIIELRPQSEMVLTKGLYRARVTLLRPAG